MCSLSYTRLSFADLGRKDTRAVKKPSTTPSSFRDLEGIVSNHFLPLAIVAELRHVDDTRGKGNSATVKVTGDQLPCSVRCNNNGATQLTLR